MYTIETSKTPDMPQPDGLISVLLDRSAEYGDRDDAAVDLGAFDEPAAEEALLTVARDPQTDPDLADSCGASLAEIWARRTAFDPSVVRALQPAARRVVIAVLRARRPDWLQFLTEP